MAAVTLSSITSSLTYQYLLLRDEEFADFYRRRFKPADLPANFPQIQEIIWAYLLSGTYAKQLEDNGYASSSSDSSTISFRGKVSWHGGEKAPCLPQKRSRSHQLCKSKVAAIVTACYSNSDSSDEAPPKKKRMNNKYGPRNNEIPSEFNVRVASSSSNGLNDGHSHQRDSSSSSSTDSDTSMKTDEDVGKKHQEKSRLQNTCTDHPFDDPTKKNNTITISKTQNKVGQPSISTSSVGESSDTECSTNDIVTKLPEQIVAQSMKKFQQGQSTPTASCSSDSTSDNQITKVGTITKQNIQQLANPSSTNCPTESLVIPRTAKEMPSKLSEPVVAQSIKKPTLQVTPVSTSGSDSSTDKITQNISVLYNEMVQSSDSSSSDSSNSSEVPTRHRPFNPYVIIKPRGAKKCTAVACSVSRTSFNTWNDTQTIMITSTPIVCKEVVSKKLKQQRSRLTIIAGKTSKKNRVIHKKSAALVKTNAKKRRKLITQSSLNVPEKEIITKMPVTAPAVSTTLLPNSSNLNDEEMPRKTIKKQDRTNSKKKKVTLRAQDSENGEGRATPLDVPNDQKLFVVSGRKHKVTSSNRQHVMEHKNDDYSHDNTSKGDTPKHTKLQDTALLKSTDKSLDKEQVHDTGSSLVSSPNSKNPSTAFESAASNSSKRSSLNLQSSHLTDAKSIRKISVGTAAVTKKATSVTRNPQKITSNPRFTEALVKQETLSSSFFDSADEETINDPEAVVQETAMDGKVKSEVSTPTRNCDVSSHSIGPNPFVSNNDNNLTTDLNNIVPSVACQKDVIQLKRFARIKHHSPSHKKNISAKNSSHKDQASTNEDVEETHNSSIASATSEKVRRSEDCEEDERNCLPESPMKLENTDVEEDKEFNAWVDDHLIDEHPECHNDEHQVECRCHVCFRRGGVKSRNYARGSGSSKERSYKSSKDDLRSDLERCGDTNGSTNSYGSDHNSNRLEKLYHDSRSRKKIHSKHDNNGGTFRKSLQEDLHNYYQVGELDKFKKSYKVGHRNRDFPRNGYKADSHNTFYSKENTPEYRHHAKDSHQDRGHKKILTYKGNRENEAHKWRRKNQENACDEFKKSYEYIDYNRDRNQDGYDELHQSLNEQYDNKYQKGECDKLKRSFKEKNWKRDSNVSSYHGKLNNGYRGGRSGRFAHGGYRGSSKCRGGRKL